MRPKPLAVPTEQLATLEKIIETHDGGPAPPNRESLREGLLPIYKDTRTVSFFRNLTLLDRLRQTRWALTYAEDDLLES